MINPKACHLTEGIPEEEVKKGRESEMTGSGQVPLTLVCAACGARQIIRVPRHRGVPPGRYRWECFECQRHSMARCVRK